ncbi:CoA-binding protein [Candidatus Pacearchaeota archaeon]|nr:CoA-binding protein [Candidatus Pacearchaeota archaeon]
MEIKSLTIIGASSSSEKFGYKALKKALEEEIEVYAVNPNKR